MLFDGGCINNLIPLSIVCSTSVLGSWYLLGIGVEGTGKTLGMGSGIADASSFLSNL